MNPKLALQRKIPLRALAVSVLALAVPVWAALLAPEALAEYGPFLWLLALVPALLLSYYRGWRGVAVALAAGMATLSVTQAVVTALGRTIPEALFAIVVAYIGIALAIGWFAEIVLRERTRIEDMALTDALTGLPNWRHAQIVLGAEFAAAKRGRPLVVVVFDLDHFKAYNDRHGHAGGDEALRALGEVLRESTRTMHLTCRVGGEEFLSVQSGSDVAGTMVFVDRVREGLSERGLGDHEPLTISAGIAAYRDAFTSPDDLVAAADGAMYEAKRAGRDRVVVAEG